MALLFLKIILWVMALMCVLAFIAQLVSAALIMAMPYPRGKWSISFIPPVLAAILFYIISQLP